METYIAMLRGINVSAQKMINMVDLKSLLMKSSYKNVRTYIQSGNVLLESNKMKPELLSQQIQKLLLKKYKFEVQVIIRTVKELSDVLAKNPFMDERDIDVDRLYVTFLSATPSRETIEKVRELNYEPDRFVISGKEVYVYCPGGYGRSKINNNFFENKLKVFGTTRNLKTVKELVRLGELSNA